MTPFYRLATALLLCTVAACSQVPSPDQGADLAPQAFGTPQNDEILALARYSGGVYAVGNTQGSLYATNRGGTDVFITKVGSDKRTLWSRQFGTAASDGASHVATDASGNVYVFGSTGGNLARALRGSSDFFLRRYNASGSVVWTRQVGLEGGETPLDLRVIGGSVHAAGQSGGEYVIYRYTSRGSLTSNYRFPVPSGLSDPQFSLDSAGNAYVAGSVDGVVDPDFGQTYDIRLYKLSGAGAPLWTKVYDFAQQENVEKVIASGRDVYVKSTRFDVPDDEDTIALYSFSGNGDLNWDRGLGTNFSNDLLLGNDVQVFVDGSGIYTDTYTRYDQEFRPQPDERVFRRYRLDGSLVWEKDFLAVGTPTAVAGRGTSAVYVGGYTGNPSNPAAPSDALLLKLSAATGATRWSK